ncbi:hypothetical protein BCV72DRAFT_220590 [Rhizopus microsporus var. microsporus]|uniref:Uncharacterized protein n=2 Tax=Rhizopus microsporus TaxID=58291 RepID=A0A2G4T7E4_RHIZD|nr:uncharacterized protein RHIMIDRAFT_252525 [Rhizopus microsporus ATCC 52813]ORE10854.1 hypothetical protein BCV72DRAFT_220590 [Rhizopus microsporus var. microsporus]PHZ16940.1 hypothetical protein RHIMIDRAFT_252525 [Rhizopus microsporus ATCC 52813]
MQIKLVTLTICASLVAIGFAAPAPQDGQSSFDSPFSDEVAPFVSVGSGPNPPAVGGIDEGAEPAFSDGFDIGENLLRKRQPLRRLGRIFNRIRKPRKHY